MFLELKMMNIYEWFMNMYNVTTYIVEEFQDENLRERILRKLKNQT